MRPRNRDSDGQQAVRRPSAPAALAVLALTVAALVFPAAGSAGSGGGKPLYWGAIIGDQYTGTPPPWDMQAAVEFSRSVGKSPSLIQFSAPFADCTHGTPCTFYGFPTEAMQNIRSFGAIPVFNWAAQSIPTKPSEPAFRLRQITRGRYDPFIRHFAEDAAQWGHPFFLRFNWEMNGFWFPWSPGVNKNTAHDFVSSWRHVHRIFEEEGATNATWVWCPNVDFARLLTPMKESYPGNRYVDWTCLDGFNWGATRNSSGWQSFGRIFHSTYERLLKLAPHKPVMIGETASERRGGSKASWITDALKTIPAKYPKVRAMVYFDYEDQGMHWQLNTPPSAAQAFARAIRPSRWVGNVYSGLPGGRISPPTWQAPPPEPAP